MFVSYDDARQRNLLISIVRNVVNGKVKLEDSFSKKDLKNKFIFRELDIIKYGTQLFYFKNKRYRLRNDKLEWCTEVIDHHNSALDVYNKASVIFCRVYGAFKSKYENEFISDLHVEYKKLWNDVFSNLVPCLHFVLLPFFNESDIYNREVIPEDDTLIFYNDISMLAELWKCNLGNGKILNNIGDESLNKKMTFRVYSNRWGHDDTYLICRKTYGWYVEYISINGKCDKNGEGALLNNLKHDGIFFPEDAVKSAMTNLWLQAEEGKLSIDKLQNYLQDVADWISAVEKTYKSASPKWLCFEN